MALGFIIVELFPHAVASVFTTEDHLIDLAATGLRYVFILFPLIGFQMVTSTFFQSIGKPKKAIFMSLTRQVIFLMPLLIILPRYWGIIGVWLSMPISDIIAVVVASILLIKQMQQLKKQKEL